MTLFRSALLGAALLAALGAGAHAQGDSGSQQLSSFQLMNGRVIVISPTGSVTMRTVDEAMAGEIMREAHPMAAGSIIFMRNGKLYAASDRPMQGGAMLSDTISRLPGR